MRESITVLEEHTMYEVSVTQLTGNNNVDCLSWYLCLIVYTSSRLAGRRWWITW